MLQKTVSKVVIYYTDGTYEELTKTYTMPPWWNTPSDYPSYTPNCSKCGLNLQQNSGFVCSSPDCPTGLSGSKC